MSKLWWSWVAVGLVACSQGADNQPGTNPMQSAAGATTSPASSGGPARPARGEATLLVNNGALGTSTQSFSGPSEGAGSDEATVSCVLSTSGSASSLLVSFSGAGDAASGADLSLDVPGLGPFSEDVTFDAQAAAQPLSLELRLVNGTSSQTYDYSRDSAADPAVSSACSVILTELTQRWVSGQVACRNLVAGGDKTAQPGARLSATVGFDCPITTKMAKPPTNEGGAGGVSGSGGVAGIGTGGTIGLGGASGAGGAPIAKSCSGIAASCSSRGSAGCLDVKGCQTSGDCQGIASGCYYRSSSYSCSDQEGCYWSSYSMSCSGSAWSCDLFNNSLGCALQEGCSWEDTCEGVSTSCSLLSDQVSCESQPGCSWD